SDHAPQSTYGPAGRSLPGRWQVADDEDDEGGRGGRRRRTRRLRRLRGGRGARGGRGVDPSVVSGAKRGLPGPGRMGIAITTNPVGRPVAMLRERSDPYSLFEAVPRLALRF